MNELRKKYVGKKVFVSRGFPVQMLDCGIFTDKNIGGYGKGIRGDYFYSSANFEEALSNKGDCLRRRIFTMDTLHELKEHLGLNKQLFSSDDYFKEYVTELIKNTRNSYVSANPEKERLEGVYVELEDIFK